MSGELLAMRADLLRARAVWKQRVGELLAEIGDHGAALADAIGDISVDDATASLQDFATARLRTFPTREA